MTATLLSALAGYIPRDRVERIFSSKNRLTQDGVALIADISGFTPLTEALTHGLSADAGAEALTRALEGVFTPLIEEIHAFRGSVIKFGGDALIVWYGREPRVRRAAVIRRAITSAWRMQQAIKIHGRVPTPIGTVTLKMKVGLTYGSIKRFNLGIAKYGYEDILGGTTLDRMAEAEHNAEPGDIMLDGETLNYLPEAATVATWRNEFAALGHLHRPARPKPWPPLQWQPEAETSLIEQLRPYVPSEIYETLAAEHTQVAELRPVVSLFIQFHGIDYDTDPQVARKLQTYFTTAQRVVARYGGRLNRLITGDKGSLIHVIFGAPRTVEEKEARAVHCALDLQQECGGLPFISMQRIGVTVGRVFAGPVGSPHRHDYTTMGDSINLSARLMQNAAEDQVLIEAAIYTQLGPEFEVADLGLITVKGKSEPISVFAALRFTPTVTTAGQSSSSSPNYPLFGRDSELALLQAEVTNLTNGQGNIVVVVGEVGMGKTHLLDHQRAYTGAPVIWANAICLAYGQTLSGYLFIDLLRHVIDLPPGLTPEEASQHLQGFCTDLFGSAQLEATYPYLARFMGLPLDDTFAQRLAGLAGESLRWQLFEVVQELLMRLSDHRPLVLALDDLQWADPTSLQLLEAILPLTTVYPILLLLATRSAHEGKTWELYPKITETAPAPHFIFLNDLDQTAAVALITHYTPGLPDHIMAYLVEKGGGNPLFLVEIVRTLQAQGLLDGQVDLGTIAIDALDLPDSVQGLLLAQIDRLAVEARHTLQMASVIGKTFLSKILGALATGEETLAKRLPTLVAGDYILPAEASKLDEAYDFRHVLIQESAYGTLLYEHRRAYHQQVAEALEHFFPGQIDKQAGLLGFHYERAGNFAQAITYHLHAADQARLLYANEEAGALYRKVLDLLDRQEAEDAQPNLDRRAKTYLKLAQVRANASDFAGAQEFYNLAFGLLARIEVLKRPAPEEWNGKERTIRLGVYDYGPSTLDPALSEIVHESEIIKDLFEGLVELDTELNVIPAMARSWHIDQGGKRYRFKLRENLQWSDGTPLTAHDFVFAWRRNLHPETKAGLAYLLYVVEGAEEFHQGQNSDPNSIAIQALGDSDLEIMLTSPVSYFPYLLADPITYPHPRHAVQCHKAAWSTPENLVCNGAFKISAWHHHQEIKLIRNPLYHGFTTGNVENALLSFIAPNLEHYSKNQVDWCRVEDQANLPNLYPQETFLAQYLSAYFLGFACHCPPFNQLIIRQVFAKSINKQALVKEAWSNVQRAAFGGVVPPGMSGHSPEVGIRFDPIGAQNLLKEAGFATGADLPKLTLAALPGFSTTPQYLQESWQEHLGIRVEIVADLSFDEVSTKVTQGIFQLVLGGWYVDYPDPDNILRAVFHSASPANYFGWKNDQFDRLVEQAATLTDQQQRMALYHQADKILVADDVGVVPLYYRQAYDLLRPGFKLEGAGKIVLGDTFKLKNILVT